MNTRDNNFALLHYIAACMVILGHMFVLTGRTAPVLLRANIHEIGVNALFVISGYLVSKSFMRKPDLKNFWIKRMMRLYPALIICVIVCALGGYFLSGLPLEAYLPGAKQYIANNILMRPQFNLPGVFLENPYPEAVNGSLWTLPIELACFLLIPFYLLIIKRVQHKVCVSTFFAVIMSCLAVYINQYCTGKMIVFWATDWMQAVRLVTYFLWGAAYSMLDQHQIKKWCRGDAAVLLLCVILCLGDCYLPKFNYIFLPYFVIAFAFAGEGLFRDFLNKHDYVYGMYLWAFPVQQTLIYFMRDQLSDVLLLFVISLCITLVLATLTSRFVEEPAGQLTKRLLR